MDFRNTGLPDGLLANYAPQVIIVGAGVGGLAAASYLCAEGFKVAIIEQRPSCGGLWASTPSGPLWTRPVYDSLETNIPRHLMTFSDQPWPANTPLLPHHSLVNQYLNHYAQTLLQKYPDHLRIELNRKITSATHITKGMSPVWKMHIAPVKFGLLNPAEIVHCPKLVVAAGNYQRPFIPLYPGVQEWNQLQPLIHSRDFPGPARFQGKNVLILGYSASGFDISMQLAGVARTIVVSTSRPAQNVDPGVHQVVSRPIAFDVHRREVLFQPAANLPDRMTDVDEIIFSTGYEYDFTFLQKRDGTSLLPPGFEVQNLFLHMLYIRDKAVQNESLAFVGLPKQGLSFTIAEAQSAFIARAFSQRLSVPCRAEMLLWNAASNSQWQQQMMMLDTPAPMSYHVLNNELDREYVNELCAKSAASSPLADGSMGKAPPFWCACLSAARAQAGAARLAFKAMKERRLEFTTYESLGGKLPSKRCAFRRKDEQGLSLARAEKRLVSCYIV